jgi:DNA-binding GntR family transcriptional regulator
MSTIRLTMRHAVGHDRRRHDDRREGTLVSPTAADATDAIASAIRAGIVRGDLAPNQRLVEVELAVTYRASRAAARGALLLLASEGLVERNRFRGARVRDVSLDEAIEITEVRMAIEALCARKAAARADDDDRKDLADIGRRMRGAAETGDLAGYSTLNQELHRRIVEMSRLTAAAVEIGRLRAQSVRHEFRLALVPGRARVSLGEHERIIEAICARDGAASEAAMRVHLASVIDALGSIRSAPVLRSTEPGGSA